MQPRTGARLLTPRRSVAAVSAAFVVAALVGAPAMAATSRAGRPAQAGSGSAASGTAAKTGLVRVAAAPRVPATATRLGTANRATAVSGDVALQPRDPAALTAAATAVSSPLSPDYRHYLAAGKFRAAFGPTAATIAVVESTLRSAHLSVGAVSSNGLLVHFSGTVAQAETAFHSTLATYRLKSGRVGMQMTAAPAFPAVVASQVSGVIGLSTLGKPVTSIEHWTKKGAAHETPIKRSAPTPPVEGAPSACPEASQNALFENGLTYDQLAHTYGLDGLFKAGDFGAGQHIAVYELYPYMPSDVTTFDTCYFGTTGATAMAGRLHSILVDGGGGDGVGAGSDEADLDVEDVSGFAPQADIDVYTGPPSNVGYLDTYDQIITADQDPFITSSYGSQPCEQQTLAFEPGLVDVENQLFEQAALQGQTVLNSAGDSGSDECAFNGSPVPVSPEVSASDPSSQPFVTSVGGTAVLNDSNRPTEQVWNDGNYGGSGGGGTSALWSAPSWQQTAIASIDPSVFAAAYGSGNSFGDGADQPCPQATSTDDTVCRTVPDVTAEADEYTGAPGIFDAAFGGWVDFGGTSSSTPLWAAMLADVQASVGCQSSGPLGFVSPKLYAVAANATQDAASFNDVTTGNNDMYALSGGQQFSATPGYDLASGLGSPRLTAPNGTPALAAYLCAQAPSNAPAVDGLSPAVEPLTPSGSLTITGTNFTGVTAVSIGGYRVPSADIDVASDTEIDVTPAPAASLTRGDPSRTGAGSAIVSVTGPGGTSAAVGASSRLEYVDTHASSTIPSVSYISPGIGATHGGNSIEVFGSGFEQGGTAAVDSVTIGGIPAASFTVTSADTLTVIVPAYDNGVTVCAPFDAEPADELCQTQLVVTGPNGSSSTASIVPLYEGSTDGSTACAGCGYLPARTEYDYIPAPTVTSLSSTYVSEQGDTVESIKGHGFAYAGYEWTVVGRPNNSAHQNLFVLSVTPDEVDIVINPKVHQSVTDIDENLRVQTAAGRSAAVPVIYAGIPMVTSRSPVAGPETGGTTITVHGQGLTSVAPSAGGGIEYLDENTGMPRDQFGGVTVDSDTTLTATTPQVLAGTYVITVCTVSGCSFPRNQKAFNKLAFIFYLPGNPVVKAVVPHHGPASGGNVVQINGSNLSSPVLVTFGTRRAVLSDGGPFGSGSANTLQVQAPPGRPGSTVKVKVTTAESKYAPGGLPSQVTTTTTYRYVPSPPSPARHVVPKEENGSVKVSWHKPLISGGARVTGYRITIIPLNFFSKKQPKPVKMKVGPKARSVVFPHLHPSLFIVEVSAVNKHGVGPPGVAVFPRSGGLIIIGIGVD